MGRETVTPARLRSLILANIQSSTSDWIQPTHLALGTPVSFGAKLIGLGKTPSPIYL